MLAHFPRPITPVAQLPPLDFFFFTDTATTEIYTLSLHDALPISRGRRRRRPARGDRVVRRPAAAHPRRRAPRRRARGAAHRVAAAHSVAGRRRDRTRATPAPDPGGRGMGTAGGAGRRALPRSPPGRRPRLGGALRCRRDALGAAVPRRVPGARRRRTDRGTGSGAARGRRPPAHAAAGRRTGRGAGPGTRRGGPGGGLP